MPSIRKIKDSYAAQVRLKGFKPQYKSFSCEKTARLWAINTENKLLSQRDTSGDLKKYELPKYLNSTLGDIGEFYTAYILSKFGFYVSMAPQKSSFDILAVCPLTGEDYKVQVKASTRSNSESCVFWVENGATKPKDANPANKYDLLAFFSLEEEKIFFKTPTGKRNIRIKKNLFTKENEYNSLMNSIEELR